MVVAAVETVVGAGTRELVETFAALGDPVRQLIVERLTEGDATVNELAALFPISLQAVSRHIKVLEAAGVVSRSRIAQSRPVHLEAAALIRTADWLDAHRARLESRYERLDAVLEELKET
ncbi:MAG: winged helix-turn-helix transcriptional regulator [Cryobacterium sp.]|nr:winged helix-turn-helix transcriptional regulator [Cryobacterium sp.]